MTRKDYIKFADGLKQLKQDVKGNYIAEAHLQDFINDTMDMFYLDNKRFDSILFTNYMNK